MDKETGGIIQEGLGDAMEFVDIAKQPVREIKKPPDINMGPMVTTFSNVGNRKKTKNRDSYNNKEDSDQTNGIFKD